MCGICGIATPGEQPAADLIRKMCSTIVHRGPDGEGLFVGPGVGLGMRRLAIIDLVTGDPVGGAAEALSPALATDCYETTLLWPSIEVGLRAWKYLDAGDRAILRLRLAVVSTRDRERALRVAAATGMLREFVVEIGLLGR